MSTMDNPFSKVRQKLVAGRIDFMGQLAKFGVDELDKRCAEDEWSALELAYHVYITDGLALEELKRVQNEENPEIVAPEEEAPRLTRAAATPPSLDMVLAGMAARREEIFEYLANLPPAVWERPFRHHAWGDRKFYQLVNVLPYHDEQHARQLAELHDRLQHTPTAPTLS